MEELRRREDLRDALAQELLPPIFKDRRLRLAVLTALYRDIATKQDLRELRNELREEMYRIRDELRNRIDHVEARIDRVETRIDSLFRWMVGLILGMWVSIMLTLIPILLKLLGAI